MLGQFVDHKNRKYNIIILAGGFGSRMGHASEFLPKGLAKIGKKRSIDLLLQKFFLVSHKIVIGTGWQSDLLENYLKGQYPDEYLTFSREDPNNLKNNATSLMYALDNVDSRYPTLVSFCDLILLSNHVLDSNSIFIATRQTQGVTGTFRHGVKNIDDRENEIIEYLAPATLSEVHNGILGLFTFNNTVHLKKIVYNLAHKNLLNDITTDVVKQYIENEIINFEEVEKVIEFGTETDLQKVRKYWEDQ
jgi:choline kinase